MQNTITQLTQQLDKVRAQSKAAVLANDVATLDKCHAKMDELQEQIDSLKPDQQRAGNVVRMGKYNYFL